MKIINGDLLSIEEGIICHQVNTYGIMGAGLALSLKNKFPLVYKEYNKHCYINKCSEDILHGTVLYVYATDKLIVANAFSQLSFETDLSKRTDLSLISIAFEDIFKIANQKNLNIYIPYKYGCGLAGGDWNQVSQVFLDLEKRFGKEITALKI